MVPSLIYANFLHRWFFLVFFSCYFKVYSQNAFKTERVDFLLTHFSNPGNKTAVGKCCDGNKTGLSCPNGCETYFRACIHGNNKFPQCISNAENHSLIIFSSSKFQWDGRSLHANPPNLVSILKATVWKDILFTVAFYDDDTRPGEVFNANYSMSELLINYTGPLAAYPGQNWSRVDHSNNGITLQFLYRIKCPKHRYGKKCSVYCESKKYSICLPNGTIACRKGYTGNGCSKAICPLSCSNHGSCISPGNCSCLKGWKGPSCAQCVPHKKCVHGTCNEAGECICKSNWIGTYCNVHKNYCTFYNPCKNKGLCSNNQARNYTCTCPATYNGTHCENFLCPSSCNLSHANCTPGIGCSCHSGWKGSDCNQCIKHSNCVNGYCVKPFECLCHNGWTGSSCNLNESRAVPCSRENDPCENNGTCRSLKNGTSFCVCEKGFSGKYCENATSCYGCNHSRGFCNDNKCSCYSGWQGPDCNQCIKSRSCLNGYCTKPFNCVCYDDWTGTLCNENKSTICSSTCNKEGGFCDEKKGCSCYHGWQGPNCNQCLKNLTCINGYCTKPFECICWEGWTGLSCNISNCSFPTKRNQSCEKPTKLLTSSNGVSVVHTIYAAVGVIVFVIFLAAFYFLWRHFRRRAEFCVTRPEIFVNNNRGKQSYHHDDIVISSLNNNFNGVRDLAKIQSTEIVKNQTFNSQDLPLTSITHENGKTNNKSLNRSDSGFVEEDL